MTDALRSRIIAHTDQPDIYDPPAHTDMYARILRDADTIRELVAALIAVEKSTDTRRQGAIATTALIAFHAKQEAH